MSKRKKQPTTSGSSDRFVVHLKRRKEPDLRLLARTLIDLALNGEPTESTGSAATKAAPGVRKTVKRDLPARDIGLNGKEAA